jgi:hypothetical protein
MEKISQHISRQWLADGKIVAYKVTALDAQGLHNWSKSIVATLTQWTSDSYLALHDLSTGVSVPLVVLTSHNILDPGLTKAGQAQVEDLLEQKSALCIRLAIVLPMSVSGRWATARGRGSSKFDITRSESQIFFERDNAVQWLESFITSSSPEA